VGVTDPDASRAKQTFTSPEHLVLGPGDDVGQSDDEGFSDGWPLGAVLNDGDSLRIDDGLTLRLGALLGWNVDTEGSMEAGVLS